MTIIEAINRIDSLKHNTYTQSDKVEWLSRLDAMVKKHIIDTHDGDEVTFTGYDDSTDLQTELLIPEPYAEVYLRWMEAQIDYYNGEYNRYNNSISMFNTAYNGYQNYYNRTHMPKGNKFKYFGATGTDTSSNKPGSGSSSTSGAVRIADVVILASAWAGTASPYSQVVTIAGTTKNSQVNLNPSVEQMAIFYEKDLTFVTENEDGVITVYAIGQKPTNDYTIQATIREVIT